MLVAFLLDGINHAANGSETVLLLLARPDIAARPRTEWTKLLRPYCKMIVDKNPGFETTEDGMDWIEKNVLLGKLNEFVTINSSATPSTILSATPSAH